MTLRYICYDSENYDGGTVEVWARSEHEARCLASERLGLPDESRVAADLAAEGD